MVCGEPHVYRMPAGEFWNCGLFILYCDETGLETAFWGREDEVDDAIAHRASSQLERIVEAANVDDVSDMAILKILDRSLIHILCEKGYCEFVLSGIHVASYGKDLENIGLLNVLEQVDRIKGVKRVRLGSLEPGCITKEFVTALAAMDKFCPHFHISLQSGSARTLAVSYTHLDVYKRQGFISPMGRK